MKRHQRIVSLSLAGASAAAMLAAVGLSGSAHASQTTLKGAVVASTSYVGKVNLKTLAAGGVTPPPPFVSNAVKASPAADKFFRAIPLRQPDLPSAKSPAQRFFAATMPASTPIARGLSLFGFTGLTHYDQRNADNGNQFSEEPPDQALAVSNQYELEAVNNALTVYNASGQRLLPPVSMNRFFNQDDEINRTTGQYGPSFSDPRAYYDSASGHWFVVQWATLNDASGNPLDISLQFVAVSVNKDPTGSYYIYHIETTNSQIPGCPCLPDYQQLGFDANGVYITHNFFSLVEPGEPYVGANIYALSKAGLESGAGSQVVQFPLLTDDFTVHPTAAPPGQNFATAENGTEYLAEALADLSNDGTASAVRIFAISGTNSLTARNPTLFLNSVDVATEGYAEPIPAVQPDGTRPLGTSLKKGNKIPPAPLLDGGSARVGATPLYVGGDVVLAVNTGLPATSSPTKDGVAWFDISVSGGATTLAASVNAQGLVSAPGGTDLIYPAVAMPTTGLGGIGVTLVGPGNYPSTAVIPLTLFATSGVGTGSIQLSGLGALPDDGFTAYAAYGGHGVGRWGDYGAAGVDSKGRLWFGNEYIPDTAVSPRTSLANWGTYLTRVVR